MLNNPIILKPCNPGLALPKAKKLSPILKWAGGKEQELKYILPKAPACIKNYYEPFVGGGAVYTAIQAEGYFINDKSDELTSLYKNIAGSHGAPFFKAVEEIKQLMFDFIVSNAEPFKGMFSETFNFNASGFLKELQVNLIRKIKRMKTL